MKRKLLRLSAIVEDNHLKKRAEVTSECSTKATSLSQIFDMTIGSIVQPYPTVTPQTLVSELENIFEREQLAQGVVVLDGQRPVGLLMKNQLYYQLGTHFGVSLYYKRPVEKVMDRCPLIVNADLPLEAVSQISMGRQDTHMYDLIIVVKEDQYVGAVSIINLLKHLTNLQIRHAANASPLTGLSGNLLIEERLKTAVQAGELFAILYIDLDNFKAFNDKYGFEHGDKALLLTATILNTCLAGFGSSQARDFLGHIGGDDFVIITQVDNMEALCRAITKKFDKEIRKLYSEEDLERNYIQVLNRKGKKEKFPIMSISIGVVHNRYRCFENYLEIGEVAAELKKKAKDVEGSVWIIDKRL